MRRYITLRRTVRRRAVLLRNIKRSIRRSIRRSIGVRLVRAIRYGAILRNAKVSKET